MMIRSSAIAWAVVALAFTGSAAAGQDHDHTAGHVGMDARETKALSPDEVAGLLAGEGMGMALAAELNSWPGPRHVLELAGPLALTDGVAAEIETIRERMRTEAVGLGQAIVDMERTLDRRFAHRHVDEAVLRELTGELARLRGELRFVHLRAHLETTALLSREQVRRYDELRGYASH
jgi:hypothetical protein